MKMKIYLYIDDKGRVQGYGSTGSEEDPNIEVDEGHEVLSNPFIYFYVDGNLVRMTQEEIEEMDAEMNVPRPPTPEEQIAGLKNELSLRSGELREARDRLVIAEVLMDNMLTVILPSLLNQGGGIKQ